MDGSQSRAQMYRLDIVSPSGTLSRGSPVAYTPVRITDADTEKEEWRAARRNSAQTVLPGANPSNPSVILEPASWPATKSAFQSGSAFAMPNGETWVFRSGKATGSLPTADVFSARGTLIGRVVLPPRTSLVGFGAASVYAVRVDDDGLKYLQRYAVRWER